MYFQFIRGPAALWHQGLEVFVVKPRQAISLPRLTPPQSQIAHTTYGFLAHARTQPVGRLLIFEKDSEVVGEKKAALAKNSRFGGVLI